jgi:hypothetical protein
MCTKELNFEKQIETNLKLTQTGKNVTRNITQLQPAVTSLFETEILSSTHRLKGYKIF